MVDSLLSVVVAVYNSQETIARTLESIMHQDYKGPIEVIVVDDGSTDSTARIVQSFSSIRYVHQKNQGPAVARNYGAALALGEIIFFTDSDCIPTTDWISKMIKHFSEKKVGVVAGSYAIANQQYRLARAIHSEIIFRHQVLMPDYPVVFGSFNFAIRRDVFKSVKGFTETYRYPSGEDNDLSYKVIALGQQIFFDKDALVAHHHPYQVRKYLREQFRHGFWRVKIYREHPLLARGDGYTFWKDIVEIPWIVLGVVLFLGGMVCCNEWLVWVSFLVLFFLWMLENIFAWKFSKNFWQTIYFGWVMLLRAGVRALGFSSGIINIIICQKSYKKKEINH